VLASSGESDIQRAIFLWIPFVNSSIDNLSTKISCPSGW
jgi:hypothetical protein